jgi:hypothetical protein
MVIGSFSPEIKMQVREADHVPPSRVEVKNHGAILPLLYTSSKHGA